VTPAFLPEELLQGRELNDRVADVPFDLDGLIEALLTSGTGNLHGKVIEEVERRVFRRVLRQTRGNQMQASELLGLNRATLRHKLRALGLSIDKVVSDDESPGG
jgi:two-component system nitrogen regulation response regulator GlnG